MRMYQPVAPPVKSVQNASHKILQVKPFIIFTKKNFTFPPGCVQGYPASRRDENRGERELSEQYHPVAARR